MLRDVRALFAGGALAGWPDGALLDRFLARRDAAGEAAFAALVDRHGPTVWRVCLAALGGDPHAAADVFQATFLALARRAGSIRERSSVGAWLFGTAARQASRARVEAARRRRHERGRALLTPEADPGATPGDDLEQAERRSRVVEEVARLPEPFRAAVVLCAFEGLTHDEAAARLGVPVGTVRSRLARGRDRLRSRLGGECEGAAPALGLLGAGPMSWPPAEVAAAAVRAAVGATTSASAAVISGITSGAVPGLAARGLGALSSFGGGTTMTGLASGLAAGLVAAGALVMATMRPGQDGGAHKPGEGGAPPPAIVAPAAPPAATAAGEDRDGDGKPDVLAATPDPTLTKLEAEIRQAEAELRELGQPLKRAMIQYKRADDRLESLKKAHAEASHRVTPDGAAPPAPAPDRPAPGPVLQPDAVGRAVQAANQAKAELDRAQRLYDEAVERLERERAALNANAAARSDPSALLTLTRDDVDGDGDMDLVEYASAPLTGEAAPEGPVVHVLRNRGDGTYEEIAPDPAKPTAPEPTPAAPATSPPATPAPATVGTIDVIRVLANLKPLNRMRETFRAESRAADAEVQRLRAECRVVAEQIEVVTTGSSEHKALEKKLNALMASYTKAREEAEAQASRAKAALAELDAEVRRTIPEIARARGLTLIVRADARGREDLVDSSPIGASLSRPVLYAGDQIDITQEVIDRLNKESHPTPSPTADNPPTP